MEMFTYVRRIRDLTKMIDRVNARIADLDKDIEHARRHVILFNKKYKRLELEVFEASKTDMCKYKLSLMYTKLLSWQKEQEERAGQFDFLNREHTGQTIKKLQYEHELETLKEITEGSGEK
jgi:hypothetical protein